MNSISQILRKLLLLFRRRRFRSDLDEEMAFHREQAERELIESGSPPEAAHTAAMRSFGNPTVLKERSHGIVAFRAEAVLQDLRFALRQFRKSPGFALTAMLILALGIGASVAIFAFVDAALIKPLPYPAPSRLVAVDENADLFPRSELSYPDYLDWKRMNTSFSSFAVYVAHRFELDTPSGTQSVHALHVSDAFFTTLGVHPMLGRDFRPSDDLAGASPVVILRYGAWQRRFGGRRDIVGQTVKLSGLAYTVVGVLPSDFEFAPRDIAEFFDPVDPSGECHQRRSCHDLDGLARLKDGVTVASAAAQMKSIARQLEKQYPDSNRGQGATVIPLSQAVVGDIKPILLVLLGGAGLLLLIACVNVSSLMLVRSENRRHEFAVRTALGASYSRVSRQMVTEALLLAGLGGALGLGLAYAGMNGLRALISADWMAGMPFLRGLGLNAHVLFFAAVLAALTGVLFSISPILHYRLSNIRAGLMETSRSSAGRVWQRMGANLVVIELATAVVLLSGAGLLAKSLYKLLHEDLGFKAGHLATANVGLPQAIFSTDARQIAFEHALLQRAAAIPGVESVALTSVLPVSCNCNTDWVRFVGRPYNGIHNEVNEREVSAGFFQTLGVPIKSGRLFNDADTAGKPKVIIINQAFADKYFPAKIPWEPSSAIPALVPIPFARSSAWWKTSRTQAWIRTSGPRSTCRLTRAPAATST